MPEVDDYRIKIEAIKERLERSSGEGGDEIRVLKERLGTVRDSLQRKQETIDNQKSEIAALRDENAQLSEMLGQAVAALETQGQGGIKEIVQTIDSEFAGLLNDGEAQADGDGGGQRAPGPAEAESQAAETETAETETAETETAESQAAETETVESEAVESEASRWEPENEAPPALQRILERHKH